jgi:hypothetical protein
MQLIGNVRKTIVMDDAKISFHDWLGIKMF